MNTNKAIRKTAILGTVIWTIASLFFLYEFFLRSFVGTISNNLMNSIHINAEQFAFVGAVYCLAYGVMQIPAGILIDRFGVKPFLCSAALICTTGIFLFGISNNFYLILLSRLLMGLGSSFSFISLLVLALNWFSNKRFGLFVGLSQTIGTAGPMLAGAPLAFLLAATHNNWRFVSVSIGILGLIISILIFLFIKDKPNDKLSTERLFQDSPKLLKENLVKLLKSKQIRWIALYSALNYVPLAFLGILWGTAYLMSMGINKPGAAFDTSMIWLGLAIGCPLFGAISDRIGNRKLVLILCSGLGIISTSLLMLTPIHNAIFWGAVFFGIGLSGAGQSIAFAAIAESKNFTCYATAFGFNNTAISLGDLILIPLISLLIRQGHYGHHLAFPHANTFTHAFVMLPLIYTIALCIVLFKLKPYSENNFTKPELSPEKA